MLIELYIKNYILIKELQIHFHDGFTVITGETGAGKTIFLGALSLLLGERADTSIVSDSNEKCIIEGTFKFQDIISPDFFSKNDIDFSEPCIIRREILTNGKSRAFINDTPVTLQLLRSLSEKLIDIHSQHSTLLLAKQPFHLQLIDAVAGTTELFSQYTKEYIYYSKLTEKIKQKKLEISEQERESDYISFLLNEIEEINPKPDEITLLETELLILENAEKIKTVLNISMSELTADDNNIISKLHTIYNSFQTIENVFPNISDINKRLMSVKIELHDIVQEISSIEQNIEIEPSKLETVHHRLDKLNNLLFKHKINELQDLFDLQKKFENQLVQIDNNKLELQKLTVQFEKLQSELSLLAKTLSEKRHIVIPQLEKKVEFILNELGMPHAIFKVETSTHTNISSKGIDNLIFLFSANKGEMPQELTKVASGGEMSRLMLALKSIIAENSKLPTLIFDEIDTGISGEIAKKMALIFNKMGKSIQLIVISHLPQVAAKANNHIIVEKIETEKHSITSMRYIIDSDRLQTIARMLSGDNFSEETFQFVKNLMK
jgi:DNA repair protein RecN (Recombination protein N)